MGLFAKYVFGIIGKNKDGDNMKKIFFLMMVMLVSGCLTNDEDEELMLESLEFKVSLVSVGDNLIHETVYKAAKTGTTYDFKPMYQEVKDYIRTFDLKFINQETILGGKEIGLSSYPCFNSPQEVGDALIDSGFNLISVANNHTLDSGEKAVLRSLKYWDRQPVIYSGAASASDGSQVKTFTINNIRFAFVAYTHGTNGIPHPGGKTYLANIYSSKKARDDLGSIRDMVDVIIVSMHWGEEYRDYPTTTQKEQAKYLSDLGADIIIGHHPHVIEPVDMLETKSGEKTFVIYSLGNFLSDQKGTDRLIGMASSIDIVKTITNGKDSVSLDNPKAKLLYRYRNYRNNSFNIKMFEDIDETFLINYQLYFDEKKALIRTYYSGIEVS
jgi:poly-gamma-glutamate synthesis protein (capsule biosynthesis protein)